MSSGRGWALSKGWLPLSEIWHKFMWRHQNDDDVAGADNDEYNVNDVVYCNQEFMFSVRSLSSVEVGSAFSLLRLLDVCAGVCLVKRNLAALLKFPARYLVALPLLSKSQAACGLHLMRPQSWDRYRNQNRDNARHSSQRQRQRQRHRETERQA